MTRAFRIGRILGLDIELDYTWFIVFFIVAAAIFTNVLGRYLPGLPIGLRAVAALTTAALFFASVLLHELSHSLVALHSGLRISGITLFLFGGVSKMTDEPRSPAVEFRMAIAGPAMSVVLAVIFLALGRILRFVPGGDLFGAVFSWLGWMNGALAIFNLLPGFPLDGGRVLRAAIWASTRNLLQATRIASTVGQGLGFLMIAVGVLRAIGGDFSGVWMALIGWFLVQAAQSSYQQLLLRQALVGVPVSSVMTQQVEWVPAQATLDQVVHDHVMRHNHPAFPVLDGSRLLGLLSLGEIRNVPRERWPWVTAAEVVPPLSQAQVVAPDTDVWDTLLRMTTSNLGRLLVMEGGLLRGIISRTDIMHLIRRRMELGM
jgi:Zn-dependent protease/CBS domain-containing protein